MKVTCYFDGGCGPDNPGGQATFGAIVKSGEGQVLLSKSGYVGKGPQMSNNVAEYEGIIAVMQFLIETGVTEGVIYGDSLLVVNQLNRKWKARKGLYLKHYKHALRLRQQLKRVQIEWIPRASNSEADQLARRAMRVTLTTTDKRRRELAELIREQRADARDRRLRFDRASA